jgi:hypothetical protein
LAHLFTRAQVYDIYKIHFHTYRDTPNASLRACAEQKVGENSRNHSHFFQLRHIDGAITNLKVADDEPRPPPSSVFDQPISRLARNDIPRQ